MVLSESMFAPAAMSEGGEVAFEQMKVQALKDELAARGSMRTGLNARRRCSGGCTHCWCRRQSRGATTPWTLICKVSRLARV